MSRNFTIPILIESGEKPSGHRREPMSSTDIWSGLRMESRTTATRSYCSMHEPPNPTVCWRMCGGGKDNAVTHLGQQVPDGVPYGGQGFHGGHMAQQLAHATVNILYARLHPLLHTLLQVTGSDGAAWGARRGTEPCRNQSGCSQNT